VGRTRIGLVLEGRRAAREGAAVLLTGDPIGHVTSGTFSPTFSRPIAMAYIGDRTARVGDQVVVDIRGSQTQATVVALPFYKRS
jgi:aminomethyltransferase